MTNAQPTHGDMTIREAMQELHCSRVTLWKLLNNGELDAYRVGTHVRIRHESIAEYKDRHAFMPTNVGALGSAV